MIGTAFVVAMLVLAGFVIIFYKLPVWFRRFLSRRYILLDILLCILAFWVLSFTLMGIIAAGFISVIVSLYLLYCKKTIPKERVKPKTSYTCKPSVHWAARTYNWWKRRRAYSV